jgi:valyl-tRNA synthetase
VNEKITDIINSSSSSAYNAQLFEKAIYNFWENSDFFKPQGSGEPFTIVMPPPNLTGELHLGHALTVAIEDSLIRWNRMNGKKTLWLPGVDHAAIAVNALVEKQLNAEGINRKDIGREKFLSKVWEFVNNSRVKIAEQHRRLGASADWSREQFTMDQGPADAVRKTFVDLYNDKLIYRGERIVNWDTSSQTVVSDLEVEYLNEEGSFWFIRYYFSDNKNQYITIATTRPETIPADTAIAVHPEDDRFKELIGKKVIVPIVNREIVIIADDMIDMNLGTGALKVTPGHDQLDFEIGLRNNLEILTMINLDGTLNDVANEFEGLDRLVARDLIVKKLHELDCIEKIELREHALSISQRTGSVIEPLISKQWFVKVKPLAEKAIDIVEKKQIDFVPEQFTKTYLHWMHNIKDWTISRQIWWGHRIPVWYCQNCSNEIVQIDDPKKCNSCNSIDILQDEDTLDTWFSSALWPHSTLGWPNKNSNDLSEFYPTQVMETGYDIIFFWVARMIMLSLYNMDGVPPFRHVYLHGLVRASDGSKMSKSKKNVIDPIKLIDEYGTDALRFSLLSSSSPGNDQRITDEKIKSGRNFANKIWNAKKFVLASLKESEISFNDNLVANHENLNLEDKWILTELNNIVNDSNRLLANFELSEALGIIRDFFWDDFADWYIEIIKIRLRDEGSESESESVNVLVHTFCSIIKLLHPFMPFITETIWQEFESYINFKNKKALIVSSYPKEDRNFQFNDSKNEFDSIRDIIKAIRNIRAENKVDASKMLEITIISQSSSELIFSMQIVISILSRCQSLNIINDKGNIDLEDCVTSSLPIGLIIVPLTELIDNENEILKINKEIINTENAIKRLNDLLSNKQFLDKAPSNVVAVNQKKLDDLSEQHNNLHNALERMSNKR